MNALKRILGASLLAIGMTVILLGLATAAGIIVVISCPFFALGLGVKYFEESKQTILT